MPFPKQDQSVWDFHFRGKHNILLSKFTLETYFSYFLVVNHLHELPRFYIYLMIKLVL